MSASITSKSGKQILETPELRHISLLERIHTGTSGWEYPHWKGTFLPTDIKPSQHLEYYCRRFSTVGYAARDAISLQGHVTRRIQDTG